MFRISNRSHQRFFLLIQALLIVCIVLNPLIAGLSVEGSVTDTSGVPLVGAHVTVDNRSKVAVTNWQGRYTISDLPAGLYTLTATHIGFNPTIQSDVSIREGISTRTNIRLIPVVLLLSPADVKLNNPINYNLQSLIVTRELWTSSAALSVDDVLRELPGVTLLEGDQSSRVSLRGSPPRTVKIDMDGIPLNDVGTGEAELGNINLQQLEAIEVEFLGIGGAISLITRQGKKYELGWEGSFGYGSSSRTESNLQLEGDRRGIIWFGSAGINSDKGDFSYKLDDETTHRRVNNQFESVSGIAKVGLEKNSWTVDGGVYYDGYNRGIPGLIYSAPTPEAKLKGERLSGRITTRIQKRFGEIEIVGYLSGNRSHYRSPASQFDPTRNGWINHIPEYNRQESNRYGITADLISLFDLGKLNLRYHYQMDQFMGEDLLKQQMTVGEVGYGDAERVVNSIDVIGEKSWFLNQFSFNLNPSLSIEWINDSNRDMYQVNSPAVSLSIIRSFHSLTTNLTAGYGRSVSLPSFNTQFLVESMFAVGNRDIKPEEGETVNIGLNLVSMSTLNLHAGVSWYQRQITNLIVWKRNFLGKYYPDNLLSARITGVDANSSVDLLSNYLSLRANYSYQNPINDTPGDINRGRLIPFNPQHSGSMETIYRVKDFRCVLRANWVGKRYSSESNVDPLSTAGMGLPAYETYDLSISRDWKMNGFTLIGMISVDNVLDRSYRVIERSPMPGRAYFLKLKITDVS